MNQRVAMVMLRKLGHQVSVVDDGAAGGGAGGGGDVRLALMDVQMPQLDGLSRDAGIRARAAAAGKPRLPIIAMTAHAMKGDRERCLEAGMDDYLSKPIRLAELAAALDRVMLDRRPDAPPRAARATPPWTLAAIPRIVFQDLPDRIGHQPRAHLPATAASSQS